MRKIKGKIYSLLLVLCFLMQLFPTVTFAADIPDDLTGNDTYLVVHNLTDSYNGLGGPSLTTVKTPENVTLYPTDNVYSDVPAGATISIEYVFHLENGDGESAIYDYSGSNYFYITLPDGISFDYSDGEETFDIIATDETTGDDWVLGSWSFSEDNDHEIKVQLSADVANHSNIWGKVGIDGTFGALGDGDATSTQMTLGTEAVTFNRELPPPPEIGLEKEGKYNAAANEITWTVTVTPPDGIDLGGYDLVDTYSSNQAYWPGSFYIDDSNIADDSLDLSTGNQITYTFAAETFGEQSVQYKTKPSSFSSENASSASSEFTNTAVIKLSDEDITEPVEAQVITDWLEKSGTTVSTSNDSIVIKWTVDVDVPNDGTITGAAITDTIPAGLQLISDGAYPVQVSINDAAETVEPGSTAGTYTYIYTDSNSVSTLVYRFPTVDETDEKLTGTAELTYYTQITDRDTYLNSNANVMFTNSAALSWAEMPDPGNQPTASREVQAVGAGGLLAKSGGSAANYIYPGYIHWSVTVNRNQVTMTGASITDEIPEGQQLLIDSNHPFIVKQSGTEIFRAPDQSSAAFYASDDAFTYTFDATITDTYTIDYYTEIVDVDSDSISDLSGLDTLYVNNDTVGFKNKVTLSRTGYSDLTAEPTKTYHSQMLAKTAASEGYNYSDHTVNWTITVNRNKLPLNNALVEDNIPNGMVLIIDEGHPFTVFKSGETEPSATNPTTINGENTYFNYQFSGEINDTYTISFYTRLTDDVLVNQWAGTQNYTNEAVLSASELSESLDATAYVDIENPVITKTFDYETGTDHIDWSVVINPGEMPLNNASVIDELDDGLQLDADSVVLYQAEVYSDGSVSAASEDTVVPEGYSIDLPTVENDNTLTVLLPVGSHAYRLEFMTYILDDDLSCTNTVNLTGDAGNVSGDGTAQEIVINNLWSSGGSGSRTLTVHKEDNDGNAVEGAVYKLLNFNQQPVLKSGSPITATTDESGDAVFNNLPTWIFYAEEISTPEGYLLNSEPFGGERLSEDRVYNTTDQPAVGDIIITKTSTRGTPLSGGEFTLSGTDYAENAVLLTAESINGTITFSNVPLGSYTITETKAPRGYVITDTEITTTIAYNRNKTGVIVSTSPDTLENEAIPSSGYTKGTVVLKKTDDTGAPLAGAEFGIYDESDTLTSTAISQDDGEVLFNDIPFGTYTIRETHAPQGYILSDVESTASLSQFERNVSADPYIIVNDKEEETVPQQPTAEAGVRITKLDSESQAPLAGAEFTLYDASGAAVLTAVTDSNGLAVFSGLEAGKNYTIQETAAPTGYIMDEQMISVSAEAGMTYDFTVFNMPDSFIDDGQLPSGGVLPQTGGFWDTFTLGMLGTLMMLLGAIMIFRKKGKHQKN